MEKGKEQELALKILKLGRTRLLLAMPYLDRVLWQLEPSSLPDARLMCDGEKLYYQPSSVIEAVRKDRSLELRIWLHPLLHALFRHMFIHEEVDRRLWDLSSDIAVENLSEDILQHELNASGNLFRNSKETLRRREQLEVIRAMVHPVTAEKVYHFLQEGAATEEQIGEWEALFALDSHDPWYRTRGKRDFYQFPEQKEGKSCYTQDSIPENSEETDHPVPASLPANSPGGKGSGRDAEYPDFEEKTDRGMPSVTRASEAKWQSLGTETANGMETSARRWSHQSGSLTQALRRLNTERIDYTTFLTRFAARCEVMKTSADEFDYIYYTYGLSIYGDVPLIEPLETREDKRIRDLVIAVDTSGSVRGDTVQAFLQKTWNIVKQRETFRQRFVLHILLADQAVQRDIAVHTEEEFDRMLEGFSIPGFGGTDFRPVFRHVDEMRKAGEFRDLRGLIYFTDGYGIFPEKRPDYLAAFVFVDRDDADRAKVPPWACRVLLDQDEIRVLNRPSM